MSDPANSTGNALGALLERVAADLEGHLDQRILFEELVARLDPWLERQQFDAGDLLFAPGRTQAGIQILFAGRVSIVDTDGKRLFQCGAGDVIGHGAAFGAQPGVTTAVAEPCVTLVLRPPEQQLLEALEPELSLKLYRFLMMEGGGAISPK